MKYKKFKIITKELNNSNVFVTRLCVVKQFKKLILQKNGIYFYFNNVKKYILFLLKMYFNLTIRGSVQMEFLHFALYIIN